MIRQVESSGEQLKYEGARGTLCIRRPAPHVVLFVESGHLEDRFATIINEHLDAVVQERPGIYIFVDAYELTGYGPRVRTRATEWLKENQESVSAQHMLVRSKVTRMGLAVASVTLGGVLHGHSTRRSFETALQETVDGPVTT